MKIGVNVLMGGPSAEHEVSLRSGREILYNLSKDKYNIRAVVVTKEKDFYFCEIDHSVHDLDSLSSPNDSPLFNGPYKANCCEELWKSCDVTLLALHGTFGEDGTVQGFLETIGIPYTGSGVYASAVAMNKITSKFIYEKGGLTVPPYSIFGKNNPDVTVDQLIENHGLPCYVKCPQSGSSRLMGCANDKKSLLKLLGELLEDSDDILVEAAVDGIEFSCGVVENPDGTIEALPPVEIRPVNSTFFDYHAKYSDGASLELVPAPRAEELLDEIKRVSLKAHNLLNCSGYSRTDMIYADSKLYVLETNTLPGMTSNSLLPKAYKAAGGTYNKLLDIMIQSALSKGDTKGK
ncbi:D-alanine--D-alanine ligase [Chitinispirillales bacterium ANBcel5]|uniref:D-alanine--D-alanine ligase family protein n=1 Tax=Cellulosispirillum alkaliphilum TaxID=3039283 RepID=UPI002A517C5A|nr:D-alanine--D-alanine ligase [Chitinispirillales bacterium ANBcel5]